jgi:hypothetical protein
LKQESKRARRNENSITSPNKKQVQFEPDSRINETEIKNESSTISSKEYKPNNLASCKKLVLNILSPYFTANRFKEKELFKEMARRITNALVTIDSSNVENNRARAKLAVKRVIKNFFSIQNSVSTMEELKKLKLSDVTSLRQPSSKMENLPQ